MPPLGIFFGWLLLGEHVAWHDLIGRAAGRNRHLSGDASGWNLAGQSVIRDGHPDYQEIAMSQPKVTLIGGPTALIEIGGFRLLTDPTFDAPGEYRLPHVTLKKTSSPALTVQEVGPIDAVLLSHDQHSDNLDNSGRAFLNEAARVITTVAGAKRLGGAQRRIAAVGNEAIGQAGRTHVAGDRDSRSARTGRDRATVRGRDRLPPHL